MPKREIFPSKLFLSFIPVLSLADPHVPTQIKPISLFSLCWSIYFFLLIAFRHNSRPSFLPSFLFFQRKLPNKNGHQPNRLAVALFFFPKAKEATWEGIMSQIPNDLPLFWPTQYISFKKTSSNISLLNCFLAEKSVSAVSLFFLLRTPLLAKRIWSAFFLSSFFLTWWIELPDEQCDDADNGGNESKWQRTMKQSGWWSMRMWRERNMTRTRNSKSLDTKTSNSTHDATENSTMQKLSDNSERLRLSGTRMN